MAWIDSSDAKAGRDHSADANRTKVIDEHPPSYKASGGSDHADADKVLDQQVDVEFSWSEDTAEPPESDSFCSPDLVDDSYAQQEDVDSW